MSLKTSDNVFLVTADVVGLFLSTACKDELETLRNALEKRKQKHIPTEKLTNMIEFVLMNNLF